MIKSFYAIKETIKQAFDKKGRRIPVTLVRAGPLVVKRIKLEEKDGYSGLVVALKRKGKEVLREIKLGKMEDFKVGQKIKITQVLKEKDKLKVRGVSRGKGFAGVVKRWHFKGGPATHGQSDRERAPGAIGQGTSPGRIWKGKRMAGRMGGGTVLIKGLKVFKIDEEKNQLWIKGLIPGVRGGIVEILKIK